jgi:hypothetical protein
MGVGVVNVASPKVASAAYTPSNWRHVKTAGENPYTFEDEGNTIAVNNNTAMRLNYLVTDEYQAIGEYEISVDVQGTMGFPNDRETQAGIVPWYLNDNNYISAQGGVAYDITVKDTVKILSDADTSKGKIPMAYRYENSDGNRFLVLNINARCEGSGMLKHYARGRQYAENIEWLSGKKLPAYVYGNPSLYVQSKKDENAMAVGLWNFFADIAVNPVVHLDKEYSEIEFINCSGELKGDKVHLSDIPAFGFVGFEVK